MAGPSSGASSSLSSLKFARISNNLWQEGILSSVTRHIPPVAASTVHWQPSLIHWLEVLPLRLQGFTPQFTYTPFLKALRHRVKFSISSSTLFYASYPLSTPHLWRFLTYLFFIFLCLCPCYAGCMWWPSPPGKFLPILWNTLRCQLLCTDILLPSPELTAPTVLCSQFYYGTRDSGNFLSHVCVSPFIGPRAPWRFKDRNCVLGILVLPRPKVVSITVAWLLLWGRNRKHIYQGSCQLLKQKMETHLGSSTLCKLCVYRLNNYLNDI